MARHCYVLRVFTDGNEGGNHLGVVTDRSGLSPLTMQEIAADLRFSETIFLDWRDKDLPRVRIFTPGTELGFAGHPLVGVAWLLHELGPGGASQIECGIGLVNIGMDGDTAWVDAPLNQRVTVDADLGGYDPGSDPLAITRVEMPVPYYLVELADVAAVTGAPPAGRGMVYVFALTGPGSVRARFFAPEVGVAEDPATGSAAVALAATMRAGGVAQGMLTISQGEEIGYPSIIKLSWDDSGARIGGTVVSDEVRWLEY